jgi:hypothetical protein
VVAARGPSVPGATSREGGQRRERDDDKHVAQHDTLVRVVGAGTANRTNTRWRATRRTLR